MTKQINFTFKVPMQKEWTLLNDRLLIGKEEIFLNEIQEVKIYCKSS